MGWLLTSTSRRLRDSATKVLVEIVDERTALLADLISDFEDVNDPYVRERLLAVAAGHVSRTTLPLTDPKAEVELLNLCDASVRLARASRPNIMVTHYTGQLLAQVGHRLPRTDLPSYRPPSTKWPLTTPTVAVLADRLEGRRRDYLHGSPIGYDFSEYILKRGTCRDFVPPDQPRLRRMRRRNAAARHRRAIAQLAQATAKRADEIETIIANRTPRTSLREIRAQARAKRAAMQRTTDDAPNKAHASKGPLPGLLADLGYHGDADHVDDTSVTQAHNSALVVRDISTPRPRTPLDELRDAHPDIVRRAERAAHEHATRDPVYLDHEDLKRWIVARVLDLGWSPESRGGPYDQPWTYTSTRSAEDKIERIGKKYSWIAHQELLAVLVQHCQRKRWDGELVTDHTMWELVHANDIDPTVTVRGDVPPTDSTSGRLLAHTRRRNLNAWWLKGWESPMATPENTDDRWLRTDDDIPDARHLLSRTDPHGDEWVVVESHLQWQIDRPGDKPGRTPHRRDMWFRTQAYLCATDAQQDIRRWSAGKDWMGLWMPTPPTYGLGYFRDYPTGEPWASWYQKSLSERTNPPAVPPVLSDSVLEAHPHLADAWEQPTEHGYPGAPIALATYGNNASTDTDMSAKSSPVCLLPSPVLVSLLDLSQTPAGAPDELGLGSAELEFRWSRDGRVVMFGTDGLKRPRFSAVPIRGAALG